MVPPRDMPKKPAKKTLRRLGRPPKPPGSKRDVSLNLRLRPDERARVDAIAAAEGLTVTALVLEAVEHFHARKK